jgi:hypothetical protein
MVSAEHDLLITRRDWILTEDPDLDALRQCQEFGAFAGTYFPQPSRRSPRPSRPHRLDESRHTASVLVTVAERWHDRWHIRATNGSGADPHRPLEWWTEEQKMLALVRAVASEGYDWRRRVRLVATANEYLRKDRQALIAEPFHGRKDDSDELGMTDAMQIDRERLYAERRMRQLTAHLRAIDDDFFKSWLRTLRARHMTTRPLMDVSAEVALCRRQAAVWQALMDWFASDPLATGPEKDFRQALRRLTHLHWRVRAVAQTRTLIRR